MAYARSEFTFLKNVLRNREVTAVNFKYPQQFLHTSPQLSEKKLRPNSHITALTTSFKDAVAEARKQKRFSLKFILRTFLRTVFPPAFRSDIMRGSNFLYEDLLEQVNVDEFITEFELPNNFDSWFKVVELHIFILSARLMEDSKVGLVARDYLWDAFWQDVERRFCRLSPGHREFHQVEFKIFRRVSKYMFASYDEGLQRDDKTLASALWRRFFSYKCDKAEYIEQLVKYIRHEVEYQYEIPFTDFLSTKHQWFIPFNQVKLFKTLPAKRMSKLLMSNG